MSKQEKSNPGNPGRLLTNTWEQSATLRSAPHTNAGALQTFHRMKARFFCTTHGLQPVANVYDSKPLDGAHVYAVTLECKCDRVAALNCNTKPIEYKVPMATDLESAGESKLC